MSSTPTNSKSGPSNASKPRKRFVGKSTVAPGRFRSAAPVNQIPQDILENPELNAAVAHLPSNYSFEINKTVHQIRKNGASMVALQMPEGLQMFACTISDIIEQFTDALTVIMGDVTYGACCIDDYTAVALGCDMLIHYGHSCLVPVDTTTIKTLYIFVEISIDSEHLTRSIRLNFPSDRNSFKTMLLSDEEKRKDIPIGSRIGVHRHLLIEGSQTASREIETTEMSDVQSSDSKRSTRLALVSTIQFAAALQRLKEDLSGSVDVESESSPNVPLTSSGSPSLLPGLWTGKYETVIPRAKPLSPGELLGCTAPSLPDVEALIYLGDGRFHLESIMIANPTVPAFRYDPYSKKFTRERYGHTEMRNLRSNAIDKARSTLRNTRGLTRSATYEGHWGVILGTLGRQGNLRQLQAITRQIEKVTESVPYIPILLSELSPAKLRLLNPFVSTFVQTSCPRLSIDWGFAFDKPLLSPYEAAVAVGRLPIWKNDEKSGQSEGGYAMDFYDSNSLWAVSRVSASLD